ncbi:unnamed protein product [Protopolystoma xenopodis]|uniref:Uncharacterized protein n=1 Tax=Protopolystoma xenopodis TaxID=117903 RepID=A0A448WVN4_9PLAT|nr:unnamed protein product [Protopolystoma xenopodis]
MFTRDPCTQDTSLLSSEGQYDSTLFLTRGSLGFHDSRNQPYHLIPRSSLFPYLPSLENTPTQKVEPKFR